MGKEAKIAKERTCRQCKNTIWSTAKQLKEHARLCERVAKSGLVLPESVTVLDKKPIIILP